jgi:hypothetical protein
MKNTRFFALLRMTTLLVCSLWFVLCSYAQSVVTYPDGTKAVQDEQGGWKFVEPSPVKYKYYFLLLRVDGKNFTIEYESGAAFQDLPDTVFLTNKNSKPSLRTYKSYSDIFVSLSAAGLEYVQNFDNPTTRFPYLMWRKKIN